MLVVFTIINQLLNSTFTVTKLGMDYLGKSNTQYSIKIVV